MKLKEIQKKSGYTREEVAKAIGINKSNYDNYLNGRNEPNIETLKKLAKYFNVTLDELCDYDIGQSKSENIKLFSEIKNKCYNLLVSLTEEQAKIVYAYMMGLTNQQFNV